MKPTDLIDWMLPPEDGDAKAIHRHRQRLTIVACSAWLTLFILVLPAMIVGIPIYGRVARASDIDTVVAQAVAPVQKAANDAAKASQDQAKETKALKIQLLERDIFNAVIEKCEARRRGSGARLWTERLQQLKGAYEDLTGRQYDEPDCTDL